MDIKTRLISSVLFWAAWIVIPLILEILPALGSFLILIKRRIDSLKVRPPIKYPEITLIVPVYNSQDSLERCIKSIDESDYPNNLIRIYFVNNKGKDDSISVFRACQNKYTDLRMTWLDSEQGKARALNLALYNSEGKYIINIDSDGVLEKTALSHMVDKFEQYPDINCMTGVVMIDYTPIKETKERGLRFVRRLEYLEYAQAFLAGRNYASEINAIYTLSGAFSGFRKSAVLKSRLYNTDTIAEDTQLTFQMRYDHGERIMLSEKSIYVTDPIEDMDKLYTQRQRWQRGSLEVSNMYASQKLSAGHMFSDLSVRTLLFDHTFAFPRMIWYVALIVLLATGYSGKTIVVAAVFMIALYFLCSFLFFISAAGFLHDFPTMRKQYLSQWYLVPLLPLYNMLTFFIRFAGIINSINTVSSWKTMTITEEKALMDKIFHDDTKGIRKVIDKVAFVFDNRSKEESKLEPIRYKTEGARILAALVHFLGFAGSVYAIFHVAVHGLIF
jgi:putative glycosyltransferase (exosortase G-associated)